MYQGAVGHHIVPRIRTLAGGVLRHDELGEAQPDYHRICLRGQPVKPNIEHVFGALP